MARMVRGLAAARVLKSALLIGGSLFTLQAQAAEVGNTSAARMADASDQNGADDAIIVTGSRIKNLGFEAPTPVTVVGLAGIEQRGTANIADLINQLPSFKASFTPASTGLTSGTVSGNYLDLRGLGVTRTLVLIDGQRVAPTYTSSAAVTGATNVNIVPTIAISRVEVVTGGASAAYGSDAVAGVANIIFDKEFQGVKAESQFGISDKGDAQNYVASLMVGSKFGDDDRGHFMIAGEYNKTKGILDQSERSWGNPGYQRYGNPADTGLGDGQPAVITRQNVTLANATYGGVIVSPGPLANLRFGPGGTVLPFVSGTERSDSFMVGGDGANMGLLNTVLVPQQRISVLASADYQFTDWFKGYASFLYGDATGSMPINPYFRLGDITIRSDNPYIPAAIKTIMTANNISSFQMGRINEDFGEVIPHGSNQTYRAILGFKGNIGSKWDWDVSYNHSSLSYKTIGEDNVIKDNFDLATDAVTDPATGNIVCRASLNAGGLPTGLQGAAQRCVPINLFGEGSPSAAALDYIHANSVYTSHNTQTVISGSISGSLFSLWAAPISVAAGAEYRKEALNIAPDSISQNAGFAVFNNKALNGSYNVKEAFAEIQVPILADIPFAKSLDVNGAIRLVDYSTSGTVKTWKVGFNWAPISSVRFRGTVSRDIRAPNLRELFTGAQLSFATVIDPCDSVRQASNPTTAANCRTAGLPTNFHQTVSTIQALSSGNPNLNPEKAITRTAGVVLTPSFLPGLRASVDWYDIKIKGAIGGLDDQQILDFCYTLSGNSLGPTCSAISRDSSGQLSQLERLVFNIAKNRTSGVDTDIVYNFHAPSIIGGEEARASFRVLGSYVYRLSDSPDGQVSFDRAGDQNGRPKLMGNASLDYDSGPLGLFGQVRYIGPSKIDNFLTSEDIDDNHVGAQWYLDLSARYSLDSEKRYQIFAGMNNVFDNKPPVVASDFFISFSTNAVFYDVIGRYMYAGVRVKF